MLGGDEGERIGREIAGEEGAKLGREIGAEAARIAGARVGLKVGKLAGLKAGRVAGKKAGIQHAMACCVEISKEKVTAMRKLFTEIASSAGSAAAILSAREEAFRAVRDVALRAAAKAAREKLLVLASKSKLTLSTAWRPTALISVINARSDLTDMEKVKLAAKAKLEGNLTDLLPQKGGEPRAASVEPGEMKVITRQQDVENFEVGAEGKWETVVFTEPEDQRVERDVGNDKVNSLKKRFETSNMKDNEAYV